MPVNAIKRLGAGYRKKTWAKPPTGLWVVVDTVIEKTPKAPVPTRPVIYNGIVTGQRGTFLITNVTTGTISEGFLIPPFPLSDYGDTTDEILIDFLTFSEDGPEILLPAIPQILNTAVGTLSRTGATVTLTPGTWDTAGVTVARQKVIAGVSTLLTGLTFDVNPGDDYYVTEIASKVGYIASAAATTATGSRPFNAPSFVGSKTVGWAGTVSNQTVSLTDLANGTDSAPQAGDLVLVSYSVGATGAPVSLSMVTSGYTTVANLNSNSSVDANLIVARKIMSGSPDTQVQVSGTGSVNNGGRLTIHVWRGVDPTTPVSMSQTATNTGARPTPPAITPSLANSVIILTAGAGASDGGGPIAFTSGLSNFLSGTANDIYDAIVGTGSYNWISGTYTPSQWGGGHTSTSFGWAAVTLVLSPIP